MKPAIWLGDSLERLREFPSGAKHELGNALRLVQEGEQPGDWQPMPSIGLGVSEIRARVEGAFRLIYIAKFAEAIYVLHTFRKKSQKTSRPDLELARQRFRTLIRDRRQR